MVRLHSAVLMVLLAFLAAPASIWASGSESAADVEFARLARKGEPLYRHYCAHCHGAQGNGDGFNSEFLDKDPAELSDHGFISKKTNERLFKVIQKGGPSVKKSYLMPVFGNTLAEAEIWSLVAYIRQLAEDFSQPVVLPAQVSHERPRFAEDTQEKIKKFSDWFGHEGRTPGLIKKGKKLFQSKLACFACHRVGKAGDGDEEEEGEEEEENDGGRVGPDLRRAGFLYKPEWLYVWIRNPQFARPKTKMPNLGVDEEKARALVAFLEVLKGKENILREDWMPYLEKEGDIEKGRKIFQDPQGVAYCAKCHTVDGEGGHVGPDLSFVGTSRTREFLLESILDPKAVITVGYSSILVLMKDGKFLTGIKLNEDEASLDLMDKEGTAVHIPKSQVKKFKTQKISMMPGNFKDILSQEEIRDLLAYLQTLQIPTLRKAQ